VTLVAAKERGGHRDSERHGQEARGGGHVVGDLDREREEDYRLRFLLVWQRGESRAWQFIGIARPVR
jgi:hypothetical protein